MDMVCFRNITVDTLRKGDTEDNNNNNNNNNVVVKALDPAWFLWQQRNVVFRQGKTIQTIAKKN
jgi:hypothetical protein